MNINNNNSPIKGLKNLKYFILKSCFFVEVLFSLKKHVSTCTNLKKEYTIINNQKTIKNVRS